MAHELCCEEVWDDTNFLVEPSVYRNQCCCHWVQRRYHRCIVDGLSLLCHIYDPFRQCLASRYKPCSLCGKSFLCRIVLQWRGYSRRYLGIMVCVGLMLLLLDAQGPDTHALPLQLSDTF